MSYIEIITLAFALAADAFAAGIGFSLNECKKSKVKRFLTALSFAAFQFIMPLLGFILGDSFSLKIKLVGAPLSFVILFTIGINMLLDDDEDIKESKGGFTVKLLILSIATSLDALTVGTAFSFLDMKVILPSLIIGVITFAVCLIGVNLCNIIKNKYSSFAQRAGGAVLIFLSIKILAQYIK